jgi:hypothetical protein
MSRLLRFHRWNSWDISHKRPDKEVIKRSSSTERRNWSEWAQRSRRENTTCADCFQQSASQLRVSPRAPALREGIFFCAVVWLENFKRRNARFETGTRNQSLNAKNPFPNCFDPTIRNNTPSPSRVVTSWKGTCADAGARVGRKKGKEKPPPSSNSALDSARLLLEQHNRPWCTVLLS